jgi:DNA-binding transcriptional regulator YiaG
LAAAKKRKWRTSEEVVADLEARIADLRGKVADRKTRTVAKKKKPGRKGPKFKPDRVIADRERLELSAADYARLVGVSPLTVYNWEHGRVAPKDKYLDRLAEIRSIGKREAARLVGKNARAKKRARKA